MSEYGLWEEYHVPTSVRDALRLLAEHGSEARLIAGGTDLLVERRHTMRPVPVLVDITRIAGLDRTYLDAEGWIHIGPGVTHNQAVASGLLAKRGRPLALACWQVGTPPLRNRGTIAGNLVTASPANDTITALWALGARVTLSSVRGERRLALAELYRGVRQTCIASDEMVTDIAFPALRSDQRGVFVKLGLRRSHAIAVVNAAAVLALDGDRVTRARVTLGSVAPTILRAPGAEETLLGGRLSAERIACAADVASQAAAPIDDIRAGAEYRRHAVRAMVRRALIALWDGADASLAFSAGLTELPASPPMLWGKTDGHFRPLTGRTASHHEGRPPSISCTVNRRQAVVHGAGGKTLLAMLRDDLGLTGAKEGCGEGECGACTVWMDGIAVFSCLVPAPRADGTELITVEGLSQGDKLHPVQQAFIDEGAVQCGYCTPGFVISGANLLEEIPDPSPAQIVAGLSGNLCRCTGYYKIVRAIERAAEGAVSGQ